MPNTKVIETVENTEEIKTTQKKKPARTKKGVVTNCKLLNVREASNKEGKILRTIPEGFEVNILGEENGFYKINNGFVMRDFIKII